MLMGRLTLETTIRCCGSVASAANQRRCDDMIMLWYSLDDNICFRCDCVIKKPVARDDEEATLPLIAAAVAVWIARRLLLQPARDAALITIMLRLALNIFSFVCLFLRLAFTTQFFRK